MIVDSGNRREFDTGAVRDIQEGKGRCDLLPLDVVAAFYNDKTAHYDTAKLFTEINEFIKTGAVRFLADAVETFLYSKSSPWNGNWAELFLEVSKHFEDGCKKYGERNWQKGIPARYYIDSAVRHYLKYLRGDSDERHDRAFCWNLLCCIWTCLHKPELNDFIEHGENQ